jgi:hypothetical protein
MVWQPVNNAARQKNNERQESFMATFFEPPVRFLFALVASKFWCQGGVFRAAKNPSPSEASGDGTFHAWQTSHATRARYADQQGRSATLPTSRR